jgi:hypothetical protein
MAKAFPDMTVSIRLRDLLEANEELVRKVRAEAEREQARRDRQAGDHLVRKEDARAILGNPDPSTLWRWEKAGYLTPVKIGVKVFYRRSAIDALIKSNEKK